MRADLVPFALPAWATLVTAEEFDGGFGVEFRFPNGRGASVIRTNGSYGGTRGLFELAGLDANGDIDMGALEPFGYVDVAGWLNPTEVVELMHKISELPPSGGQGRTELEERA